MLRIAQLNDTHEGITTTKTIRKLLLKLKQEHFDILLHCGDYSGGVNGCKTLGSTVRLIRDIFPDKKYVTVIGNHDYWSMDTRIFRSHDAASNHKVVTTTELFHKNYESILQTFKDHDVWFLDQQGPYRLGDYVLVGHSGWYANSEIVCVSKDFKYLPYGMDGDTNRYMYKRAMDELHKNLDALTPVDREKVLLFVSHFPVIKEGPENAGYDLFSWSASLGDFLQEDYGVRWFFNGHAHQDHTGPLRWETGTDYYKPKYRIVEISKS